MCVSPVPDVVELVNVGIMSLVCVVADVSEEETVMSDVSGMGPFYCTRKPQTTVSTVKTRKSASKISSSYLNSLMIIFLCFSLRVIFQKRGKHRVVNLVGIVSEIVSSMDACARLTTSMSSLKISSIPVAQPHGACIIIRTVLDGFAGNARLRLSRAGLKHRTLACWRTLEGSRLS